MKGVKGENPRELDQFFTKESVAKNCVKHLKCVISCDIESFDCVVEPSFGEGAFVKAIQLNVKSTKRTTGKFNDKSQKDRLIYVDIDAIDKKHRYDFLKDTYVIDIVKKNKNKGGCLTIGNPPFGKNSSLAIEFFNKAAEFSDIIAFIIPRTFCKQSVKNKLNRTFFLIDEYELDNQIENESDKGSKSEHEKGLFTFKGKSYNVPCVFQIWSNTKSFIKDEYIKNNMFKSNRPLYPKFSKTKHFTFVNKTNSTVDLAIRRVGVNAGRIFDKSPEECSKESHLFLLFTHNDHSEVIENLKALDLENIKSKYNTAGCPSISKTELCSLYTEKYLPSPGK